VLNERAVWRLLLDAYYGIPDICEALFYPESNTEKMRCTTLFYKTMGWLKSAIFKDRLAVAVMPDLIRHPESLRPYFLDSGSEAGMTSCLATTWALLRLRARYLNHP